MPSGREQNLEDTHAHVAAHGSERNRLLAALPIREYVGILPHLIPTPLRFKHILYEPKQIMSDVYFVRDGVASFVAIEDGKDAIEVGLVGNEGFIGLPVLFGVGSSPNRIIIQVQGEAWKMSAAHFERFVDQNPAMRSACLRFAHYFNVQIAQTVACNRLHALDQRCARWLLMTLDRVQGDVFETTHEFLALMLGVRRAGVTVAMGKMQSAGILRYTRGRIEILNRAALEEVSCSCYEATRAERDETKVT